MSKCKIEAMRAIGGKVAYLKRQYDGRYTINAGPATTGGCDEWFSLEATTLKGAQAYFRDFVNAYFNDEFSGLICGNIITDIEDWYIVNDFTRIDPMDPNYE